jgi:hypothetical protein
MVIRLACRSAELLLLLLLLLIVDAIESRR